MIRNRAGAFWLLVTLLGVTALGCGKRPSAAECDELLDKYVELLLLEDRPGASAAEIMRVRQEARRKAQTDPAFHECSARVSRRSFECAMQAADANRLEQCLL